MSKKGENIFKRKDGRWEGRYIKGYDVSGKIRYGFCYGKTYQEAKEKVLEAKLALQGKMLMQSKKDRRQMSRFCDEWLALQKNEVRESTYIKYFTVIEKYVKPKLGKYHPLSFNTQVVETFKRELLEIEKLSPKTVRDILIVLHSVIKYTEKQLHVQFSNLDFRYPKIERKERRVLSVEEWQCILAFLLSDLEACRFGILLAALTGMRLGEICALKWECISVKDRTIRICATIQRLKNSDSNAEKKTSLWIGNPKSDSSYRIIPMSDSVAELCNRIGQYDPSDYILTGTANPMDPRTVQNRLKKYAAECGIENIHFHTLRHSFSSRCVEAGFDVKSLSEILGHANTSITLNCYVHASMEQKRANMNRISLLSV